MKIHVWLLLAALVELAACGQSSPPATATNGAAPSAPVAEANKTAVPATPATPEVTTAQSAADAQAKAQADAQAQIVKKAQALTHEQIAQSRDPSSLARLSQVYLTAQDPDRFKWTLERLVELLPNSGNLKLQLAMAYAGEDSKTQTYDTLMKLLNQGYSYDIEKDPRFDNVHGNKLWNYIVVNNANNGKPFGEGKVAFDLPKGDLLLESIAWDPTRKEFLVGSVREGKVYLSDASGKLTDFISSDAVNGLTGVFGLAVDAPRDKLYVIANGVPYFNQFKADMLGTGALYEFALSSGKFIHKYNLPSDGKNHVLTSVTAGAGLVFVADGVNQEIYRADAGALKLVTGNTALTGIRGIALSGDGKILYLADEALGIFGLDLSKTKAFEIAHNADKLTFGGIDGLYWYDGALIAIQNEMQPQRIMRFKLSPDGRSVTAAMALDVAQPSFKLLTVGTVAGDKFYTIVNSQKGLYDKYGVLTDSANLEPVHIFSSNLRFAWDDKGVGGGTVLPVKNRTVTPEELQKMRTTAPRGLIPADAPAPTAEPPPLLKARPAADANGH